MPGISDVAAHVIAGEVGLDMRTTLTEVCCNGRIGSLLVR